MLQWTSPGKHFNRPFHFESFWFTNPEFKGMVQDVWKSFTPPLGAKMYQFQQKLRHLKQAIKAWNKSKFGNILDARKNLEQNMCDLQQTIITEGRTDELANKEHSLWMELEARRLQEEILWKQKSRIRWLKEGEKNTKFFHRSTIQRRMHNNIAFINNNQGDRIEKHEDIEKAFRDHFQEALKEQPGSCEAAIKAFTKHVPKIITEDQNQNLLKQVTMQEVDEAMAQLKDGKAPGPDGFTGNFFHEFWDLISSEVWDLVEESRSMHWVLPSLNSTFIALVPKGKEANTPDKFRPIALCNVIYKLISKVVANRLKPLLPQLILPEQTANVARLRIQRNLDTLDYEPHILPMLFCPPQWLPIHALPFFARNLPRGPSLPIHFHSYGRRAQSPPPSHCFINAVKGLALHALNLLSHQQFVDDTMLFGHSSSQEAKAFKSLFSLFSEASGTSINASKSQLFFFNTPVSTQCNIARILGFSIATLPSKYLGAPLMASALKHTSWGTLLDKLEARLSSWTYRSLNIASRLTLIKSVLQEMPLYLFSILVAPKWVLKAIRNLQRGFLWGSNGLNRKWALLKWTEVCQSKANGGLGLRDPLQTNSTMGEKIWWN
eukprot:PITA_05215